MLVIADTTPLTYLIRIELESILPKLFGSVIITPYVRAELASSGAPESVRRWVECLPDWVEVCPPDPVCYDDPRCRSRLIGSLA